MLEAFVLKQDFCEEFLCFLVEKVRFELKWCMARGDCFLILKKTLRDTGLWHFGMSRRALACIELYQLYAVASYVWWQQLIWRLYLENCICPSLLAMCHRHISINLLIIMIIGCFLICWHCRTSIAKLQ